MEDSATAALVTSGLRRSFVRLTRRPHPLENVILQKKTMVQRRAYVCRKQSAQNILPVRVSSFSRSRKHTVQRHPARYINQPEKRCFPRPRRNGNVPTDRHGKGQRVQNEVSRQSRKALNGRNRVGQGRWSMSQPPEEAGRGQYENRYSGRFVQRRYRCLDLPRVEIIYSPSEYDGREHAQGYQPVKANCDPSVSQRCDI